MTLVLDTSVSMAWCFKDEQTEAAVALLDRVIAHGAFAPQLWPVEAANGLLMAERRGRITNRTDLLRFLKQLPVQLDADTAGQAWRVTSDLARANGLTAYDATYLELAIRLALPLATLDRQLAAAARTSGVVVLPG